MWSADDRPRHSVHATEGGEARAVGLRISDCGMNDIWDFGFRIADFGFASQGWAILANVIPSEARDLLTMHLIVSSVSARSISRALLQKNRRDDVVGRFLASLGMTSAPN